MGLEGCADGLVSVSKPVDLGTQCFTQVRALLMEVKPYVLLD